MASEQENVNVPQESVEETQPEEMQPEETQPEETQPEMQPEETAPTSTGDEAAPTTIGDELATPMEETAPPAGTDAETFDETPATTTPTDVGATPAKPSTKEKISDMIHQTGDKIKGMKDKITNK
ncbi:unnamed protein product [Calypogeia fissa]